MRPTRPCIFVTISFTSLSILTLFLVFPTPPTLLVLLRPQIFSVDQASLVQKMECNEMSFYNRARAWAVRRGWKLSAAFPWVLWAWPRFLFFIYGSLKSQPSQLCGLSVCESQMDANKASETVKLPTEERDSMDWQMSGKLDIQHFQGDVWHAA